VQTSTTVHALQQLIQHNAKSHAASNAKNIATVRATIIICRYVQVIAHLNSATVLVTLAVTVGVDVAVNVTLSVLAT